MKLAKKFSTLMLSLFIFLSFTFLLVGCKPSGEMKIFLFGNKKTVGTNHDVYDYSLVGISYSPYAKEDVYLVPSDFYIEIDGEKFLGQSFLIEETIKMVMNGSTGEFDIITEISFIDLIVISKDIGGSVNVYFGCSLENVEAVYYKNAKLPLVN